MARYEVDYLDGFSSVYEADRAEYDSDARMHVFYSADRTVALVSSGNVRSVTRLAEDEGGVPQTNEEPARPPAQPTGAVIEIIEKGATTSSDEPGKSVIVPNDVRINGQSLLASADDPVIVHQISTRGDDLVRVTLTLFARRVSIRAENDPEGVSP
ncbi:hypothetical protein [Streptomyces sp. NRRL F-5630]|uniref:hypothetical protein n=1 Tax=Streptomyces sp. NRRL F-5630 TaxID=1463864 RepID=UPI003D751E25